MGKLIQLTVLGVRNKIEIQIIFNYKYMSHIKYELPRLPYEYNALEPVISAEVMQLHHDKHHMAYVTGANAALEKLQKARNKEIEVDMRAVLRDLSFNVNGHLLHTLFWENMKAPMDDNMPSTKLNDLIN